MKFPGLDILFFLIIPAIAIPVFFGMRWVLRRVIKSNVLLRQVLTWAGTIMLTLLLFAGLVVLGIYYEDYYPSRRFNETTWLTDNEHRYEMTEDLIKSEILIGKTKEEVQKLLGNTPYKYSDDRWVYYVGTRPGFRFDQDSIHIYFRNGKVEKVEHHETSK